eukprot:SAG31_NODE_1722_length_7452_cov_2.771658_1_plen_96_part_00
MWSAKPIPYHLDRGAFLFNIFSLFSCKYPLRFSITRVNYRELDFVVARWRPGLEAGPCPGVEGRSTVPAALSILLASLIFATFFSKSKQAFVVSV